MRGSRSRLRTGRLWWRRLALTDPHHPITLDERLPRRLVAVPQARRLAADALSHDAHDDLALVITELVGNAVRHGRGRRIALRLQATGASVRVEVENRRRTTLPRRRLPSDIRPSGRGLTLVAACSREWGVVAGDRGLTRVWAELERPAAAAPAP